MIVAQIKVLKMVHAGNNESPPLSEESCRAKNSNGDVSGSPIM
jgi:hypothetical protein